MRLAILAGLYVAVVLSAQIGAKKFIRLPFTHLVAPGGVYSIGVALALVQLAHYSGATRRDGAVNAQLLIGLGFVGSAFFAGYIAHPRPLASGRSGAGVRPRGRLDVAHRRRQPRRLPRLGDGGQPRRRTAARPRPRRRPVVVSAGASAPLDSFVFLVLAFGWSGLHFFDGQLVGKIASSVVIGIPLVLLGRRFLAAKSGDIVPA